MVGYLLALLLAVLGPPSYNGRMTWYGTEFDGRPTASGETYSVEGRTCAINLQLWRSEFACGYGRGECRKALVCGDAGCAIVEINDTGAFVHLLDCSPAVFERVVGDLGIGIGNVRLWNEKGEMANAPD